MNVSTQKQCSNSYRLSMRVGCRALLFLFLANLSIFSNILYASDYSNKLYGFSSYSDNTAGQWSLETAPAYFAFRGFSLDLLMNLNEQHAVGIITASMQLPKVFKSLFFTSNNYDELEFNWKFAGGIQYRYFPSKWRHKGIYLSLIQGFEFWEINSQEGQIKTSNYITVFAPGKLWKINKQFSINFQALFMYHHTNNENYELGNTQFSLRQNVVAANILFSYRF